MALIFASAHPHQVWSPRPTLAKVRDANWRRPQLAESERKLLLTIGAKLIEILEEKKEGEKLAESATREHDESL